MHVLRKLAGLVALAISLAVTPVAASAEVTPLVSTDWLAERLDTSDVVILDIRSSFAGSGKEDYLAGHVPGALWSEYPGIWRTNRGEVVGVLPPVEQLETALSDLGIGEGKTVVIVPAGGNSTEFGAAARIYWTLKYLGHDAVAILDGGHRRWVEENRELETGEVTPTSARFVASPRRRLPRRDAGCGVPHEFLDRAGSTAGRPLSFPARRSTRRQPASGTFPVRSTSIRRRSTMTSPVG